MQFRPYIQALFCCTLAVMSVLHVSAQQSQSGSLPPQSSQSSGPQSSPPITYIAQLDQISLQMNGNTVKLATRLNLLPSNVFPSDYDYSKDIGVKAYIKASNVQDTTPYGSVLDDKAFSNITKPLGEPGKPLTGVDISGSFDVSGAWATMEVLTFTVTSNSSKFSSLTYQVPLALLRELAHLRAVPSQARPTLDLKVYVTDRKVVVFVRPVNASAQTVTVELRQDSEMGTVVESKKEDLIPQETAYRFEFIPSNSLNDKKFVVVAKADRANDAVRVTAENSMSNIMLKPRVNAQFFEYTSSADVSNNSNIIVHLVGTNATHATYTVIDSSGTRSDPKTVPLKTPLRELSGSKTDAEISLATALEEGKEYKVELTPVYMFMAPDGTQIDKLEAPNVVTHAPVVGLKSEWLDQIQIKFTAAGLQFTAVTETNATLNIVPIALFPDKTKDIPLPGLPFVSVKADTAPTYLARFDTLVAFRTELDKETTAKNDSASTTTGSPAPIERPLPAAFKIIVTTDEKIHRTKSEIIVLDMEGSDPSAQPLTHFAQDTTQTAKTALKTPNGVPKSIPKTIIHIKDVLKSGLPTVFGLLLSFVNR